MGLLRRKERLAQLSDDALALRMKPGPIEESFNKIGCGSLAAAALFVLCVLVFWGIQRIGSEIVYFFSPALYEHLPLVNLDDFTRYAVAGFFGFGILLVLIHDRFTDRRAPYEKEWQRRYPLGKDVKEAEDSLAITGADWILILSGRSLPHGGPFRVRVDVAADEQFSSLRALLIDFDRAIAAGEDVMGQSYPVYDGTPCTLHIIEREPRRTLSYELNLGEYLSHEKLPLVPALCSELTLHQANRIDVDH